MNVTVPFEMVDDILHPFGYEDYGWGVRVWMKQGVIITGRWGRTTFDLEAGREQTSLLSWSDKDQDYCKPISVVTDDITRLEIL